MTKPNEEWDPMKEDYDNPNFNTYIDPTGGNINLFLPPSNTTNNSRGNGKNLELFVGNVPPEFDEVGINNIFLNFGKILRVYKPSRFKGQHGYAFVTFSNQSEAEAAIRALDKVSPFNLRVRYALTNQEKDARNKNKEHNESVIKALSEEPPNSMPTKPQRTGISRGRMINRLGLETIINNCWENLRKPNNDPVGKMRFYQSSKYENCNAFLCDIYCKIRRQMDEAKYNKVTMTLTRGRGHLLSTSELTLNKGEEIINIKNVPQYTGIPPPNYSRMDCAWCGFLSPLECPRCKSPYCTSSCYTIDSSEHELECKHSDLNNGFIKLTKINGVTKDNSHALKLNEIMDIIIIMQYSANQYWVIKKEHLKALTNINEKLQKYAINAPGCELNMGEFCAVQVEGIWFRGQIIALLPKLMVRLIDYGDDHLVLPTQIKKLSSEEKKIPEFAFRIKLKVDHDLKEGKEIKIKILKKSSQGYYKAHLLPRKEKNESTTIEFKDHKYLFPKTQKPPTSVLNQPIKNSLGKLKFVRQMRGKRSGTVILTYSKFESIQNELAKLPSDVGNMPENPPNWRPRPDLLIAAHWSGNWYRGYVLGFVGEVYVVALCDKGIVILTKLIRPGPKHFQEVPELSVFCTIPDNETITWDPTQEYDCKIVYSENDLYICQILINEEPIASLELERWKPRVEDFGYHLLTIPNNSEVSISCYHSQNWVSVRPYDPTINGEFLRMTMDINTHCMYADNLDRPPYIGELVACRFEADGNWYRSYINRIEKENVHIVHIDYGNHDIVSIKQIKPLSARLKLRAVQSMLIELDDIPDGYINYDIISYFYDLIVNKTPLKINYSPKQIDIPAKLYMTKRNNNALCTESTINSEIKDLMQPKWKKLLDSGKNPADKVFMIEKNDITLKISKRETFPLVFLTYLDDQQFYGVRFDTDITFTVLEKLNEDMGAYFKAVPEEPYVPRPNEIAIVYYYKEDRYYRAVNVESFSNTCRITFFDTGLQEEIEYINIRKMIPEFMELPNIGILCQLHGLRENLKPSEWTEITTMILPNTIYSAEVVSVEDDVAFIDLLDMHDQLEKFKE